MIEKIAEFMGWVKIGIFWNRTQYDPRGVRVSVPVPIDNPLDWGYWMKDVEPRIRERGMWSFYINVLYPETEGLLVKNLSWFGVYDIMSATLEQRAQALLRVLEERDA